VSIVHRNRTMHTNVSNASEASVFVPVEIPRRAPKNNDVAVCVKAAYHKIDHRRLVEWFELQRLLGVTSIGVYTTPLTHPDTRKTLAQYGRTWLSTQRTVDYPDGGSGKGHQRIAHLAGVNDCLYRHLYTHRFVAVIDFDEVLTVQLTCVCKQICRTPI